MGFFDLFKKKKADPIPDFAARMEARAKMRDDLFAGQRPDDPDYGYTTSNPVMTSTISSSDRYLERLRTAEGKSFTWHRVGSFCMRELHGVEGVMVDEYKLFIDEIEYKSIFICPYGHSSKHTPAGLFLEE